MRSRSSLGKHLQPSNPLQPRHGMCANTALRSGASGIGKASAKMWLQQGGLVVAADINDAAGLAFEAEHPSSVKFVHCDTRRRSDLLAAAAVAHKMGPLTCWFSNAGIGESSRLPGQVRAR